MKTITINVSAAGSAKIEADGFAGCGCAEATEQIELALNGGRKADKNRKPKPEFYASPGVNAENKFTF